jgi:hypothetical protein
MEDNLLELVELSEDELEVVAGGGNTSCYNPCSPPPCGGSGVKIGLDVDVSLKIGLCL